LLSQTKLKSLTSLKQKKYRQQTGHFLVEGIRLCETLLDSSFETQQVVFCPDMLNSARAETVINAFRKRGVSVDELDKQATNKLSDTKTPQGIFAVARMRNITFAALIEQQPETLLVSDNISEPGNLGTIIRTAAWFGVDGLLLSSETVEYSNPKVVRSSAGAVFNVPIVTNLDLKKVLPALLTAGYDITLSDIDKGDSYLTYAWSGKTALVLGNEADGISESVRSFDLKRICIPRYGSGESLNVSAAAAILLAAKCKNSTGKIPS